MTTSSWVNRVKSRMKELNMTQEDLAKKMGRGFKGASKFV